MNDKNYCTIYLVRHGESEANVKGVYGLDTNLTEKGKKQAREIAKKFKTIHFDAVFSSPLIRAKETAEIIAKEHKLIVLIKESLRERHAGALEGKSGEEAKEMLQELYSMRKNLPYEQWKKMSIAQDYETDEQMMLRFITALREIAFAYRGKTVLVGNHTALMRTLLIHLGITTYKELAGQLFENGGYIKLRTDGIDFFVREIKGLVIEKK